MRLVRYAYEGNRNLNLQAGFYIQKSGRGKCIHGRKICRPEVYIQNVTREPAKCRKKSAAQRLCTGRKQDFWCGVTWMATRN